MSHGESAKPKLKQSGGKINPNRQRYGHGKNHKALMVARRQEQLSRVANWRNPVDIAKARAQFAAYWRSLNGPKRTQAKL